jgi:hypothetical protein
MKKWPDFASTVTFLAVLGACRTVPQRKCVPATGSERWIETRHTANPALRDDFNLRLRLVADTGSSRAPRDQQMILRVLSTDSTWLPAMRPMIITAAAPVTLRLPVGTHVIALSGIGYESLRHDVVIAPDKQVMVDVQPRHAAYCLGRVIETRA